MNNPGWCYHVLHLTSFEHPLKYPGKFITFEGLDGSGKSTQLRREAERLRGLGRAIVATEEPGGTAVGRKIREIVLDGSSGWLSPPTELALMFAARAQHLAEVIVPALKRGEIVLCDRFTDSTVAYQGYGRGLSLEAIGSLENVFCGGVRPDLTLVLDIDPPTAAERTGARNRSSRATATRFETEGLEFFRRVQQGYRALAQQEPDRVRIIDGRAGIAEVHLQVRRWVDEQLVRISHHASPRRGRKNLARNDK